MSEFHELIKSVAKSREYVRDFYVYGFKSREDFDKKSARTYDNERRRIESWFASHMKSEYNGPVKNVSLSLNTNWLSSNPLYRIYEAKSFTDNDILLHFYLLDILLDSTARTADELTDEIINRFEIDLEVQLVRKKANEYVTEGILVSEKRGRRMYYSLSQDCPLSEKNSLSQDYPLSEKTILALKEAICFFQMEAPIGFVGYSLMKKWNLFNDLFLIKHGYFVHALEEEILFRLLTALNLHQQITLKIQSNRSRPVQRIQIVRGIPLRIFVSTRTGRRFLCLFLPSKRRLSTVRLDQVKEVTWNGEIADYNTYQEMLERNLPQCFGVSFNGPKRRTRIKLTLNIIEPYELFVVDRLRTEGRGGTVTRVGDNTYTYEICIFDGNEIMPWIRTFIGRILSFECDDEILQKRFQDDINQMMEMYGIPATEKV